MMGVFVLVAPSAFANTVAVEEVGVTVSDAARSLTFFRDALGCVPRSDDEASGAEIESVQGVFSARLRVIRCQIGDETLALMEFLTPRGRTIPPDQRSQDGGFQHVAIVVRDMDAAYRSLRERHVRPVSPEPQTLPAWNRAAAGIRAYYFADPDGHTLELIWFPPGKGDPRWQRPSAALFLGVDHTAIGVADTERSLALYRDRLGLRVVGESRNWGPEQEHLNNVFGAHLRITSLRGAAGPGIELLEYLSPRDGRPVPPDLRANDLLHWQTVLRLETLDPALAAVGSSVRRVSAAPIVVHDGPLRAGRSALVRDADGHALLLREARTP